MREEFLSKIGWTRLFISGPPDPVDKPHMVWCHVCKKNFSIIWKGSLETLRHHQTEKHLQRDQRWRYEHLNSVVFVTGIVHHRVRGKNRKVLTKIELAKKLPKFIHAELIDIGERFPFYEDFVKGSTTALVTPGSQTNIQQVWWATSSRHMVTYWTCGICGGEWVHSLNSKPPSETLTGESGELL